MTDNHTAQQSQPTSPIERVKATSDDFPWLLALRLETMGPHFVSAGLHLSEQHHSERVLEDYQHAHVLYLGDRKIGLFKYRIEQEQAYVMQLQIASEYQGQGLGSCILKQFIAEVHPKPVMLNVLKTNPAQHLYLRMGFVQFGQDQYEYHLRYLPTC